MGYDPSRIRRRYSRLLTGYESVVENTWRDILYQCFGDSFDIEHQSKFVYKDAHDDRIGTAVPDLIVVKYDQTPVFVMEYSCSITSRYLPSLISQFIDGYAFKDLESDIEVEEEDAYESPNTTYPYYQSPSEAEECVYPGTEVSCSDHSDSMCYDNFMPIF
ncbi:hypothetical protein BJ085DRAFT_29747 [Dimargaris cristalligena]|uniref:Uncharacterized protein n=1 Tax=Dimargaris cristalligena TaxID=215637 RepID=A0A4P9ZLE7_9FUNG|nr:hypothetical protein BJ085DRAFT_29747 [Dimargaris cristalligena]|eukprot:RKP33918.1 hypothetical protein BJ085DRAFT_29747 [Dimargaris cristalligena]